ncbi:MAG: iron-sulfur cluster carrier protein MrpORP [Victivallaceae bacterium]
MENQVEGCGGSCGKSEDDLALARNMAGIRHKIVVMSGKGGVGKSTVAVNLAAALAAAGKRVGLLDADIHGPSIPTMLGLTGARPEPAVDGRIAPIEAGTLKVMSIGFLLRDCDDAVIWRGPMKIGAIRQLLGEVAWGELDFLVIDTPPGTGDEPLSVCQSVGAGAQAVIVTTPQEVSAADVRKSVDFCSKLDIPVIGIVENMSGFVCPCCGEVTAIFRAGAGKSLAGRFGLRLLGQIPLDPGVCDAGDGGKPFVGLASGSAAAKAFAGVIAPILLLAVENEPKKEKQTMKIAIPMAAGKLCLHFGHCEQFVLIDVEKNAVTGKTPVTPPPHEPGLLPRWLAEKGVTLIIAGGMGARAQQLFAERDIQVITGAPADDPEQLVAAFLNGTLVTGENACDH